MNIYIPNGLKSLKDIQDKRIKLALQARSGQGKTFSALTFPNPVIADFDSNLQAHSGREDVVLVPFCDDAFVNALVKKTAQRPNVRDAFKKWLQTEAVKLTPEQTLVVDSWTRLQDSFDEQTDSEPVRTRSGDVDEFAFWARKQDYAKEVLNLLANLRCNLVVTFHEVEMTDDKGKVITGRVIPLMQGKFVNKLGLYFSDWFRCWFFGKGSKLPDSISKNLPNGPKEAEADLGLWQTKSDNFSDCKTRMKSCPMFIAANYSSFNY